MEEITVIEKMQVMCEESCSPDQFDAWENLKSHLMKTRKSLRHPAEHRKMNYLELLQMFITENGYRLSGLEMLMFKHFAEWLNTAQQMREPDVMPCGHSLAESYQGGDGGTYCRICESA